MEIVKVDVLDRRQFDAWHATYAEAESFGRGDHSSDWLLEEARAAKQADDPHRTVWVFSGVEGGQVVACSEVELWHNDNPHLARGKVWTRPGARGQGYGTAMAEHLEGQARSLGCRTLVAEVAYPWECPPDGAGHRDAEFARHRGYDLALGEVQRVLRLPVAQERLAALLAETAPMREGYRLTSFTGRVPDEIVEGYVALVSSLDTEAPVGDLDIGQVEPDVAAFRVEEETTAAQQRTRWATAVLAPDGTVAGYTDLVTSAIDPRRAYQWGTLVHRAHRGRRLGLALKAANLLHLQRGGVGATQVHTWNADVNAHMVAVNDLLGFAPVERLGEFQKKLLDDRS